MNNADLRISEVESSASFVSDKYVTQKKEFEAANNNIRTLRETCSSIHTDVVALEKERESLNKTVNDLELRENLFFYGCTEEPEMPTLFEKASMLEEPPRIKDHLS